MHTRIDTKGIAAYFIHGFVEQGCLVEDSTVLKLLVLLKQQRVEYRWFAVLHTVSHRGNKDA